MNASKFTENSPGRLVEIDRADHPRKKDWAFIPNELPPGRELDQNIWPLISEARDRLGTLNGIGQTLPDPELLLRPLQNREAIASSQIEGTFVTPEQLLLFEMAPKEPKSRHDAELADWVEVKNYGTALKVGGEMIETRPLNNHVIRSMHAKLMLGVRGRNKSPGKFRDRQVQIGSDARYIPPPASEVEGLMRNLEGFIAHPSGSPDPLVTCFLVHYQFETIHPFEDGNGRVGRALLALMMKKLLSHKHPWLYLSAYFDKFQDEYFANLFQVSATGDWNRWIEYCMNGTIAQANDAIRRCNRFKELQEAYHQRVKALSPTPRSHLLVNHLFREPIVRVASVKQHFDIHYATAKADIEKLMECGILKELTDRRPKLYYASEIMNIAYEEVDPF